MATDVYTKAQYLIDRHKPENKGKSELLHHNYYAGIVSALGEDIFLRIPFKPEQVADVLQAGDRSLNRLPLYAWDIAGELLQHSPTFRLVLEERGDFPALSTAVCTLKAAAIVRWAESQKK